MWLVWEWLAAAALLFNCVRLVLWATSCEGMQRMLLGMWQRAEWVQLAVCLPVVAGRYVMCCSGCWCIHGASHSEAWYRLGQGQDGSLMLGAWAEALYCASR